MNKQSDSLNATATVQSEQDSRVQTAPVRYELHEGDVFERHGYCYITERDPLTWGEMSIVTIQTGTPYCGAPTHELVRRANAMTKVEALCISIASNKECEAPRRALAKAVLELLDGAE